MKRLLFVFLLTLLGRAFAQIDIYDINTFKSSTSQPNCTGTHQSQPEPGWENNCDEGTPNCSANKGHICTSMSNTLVTTPSLDNQAREMDVSWSCPNGNSTCPTAYGGAIFHSGINSSSNLDIKDSQFSWSIWVYHTDLSHINQLEFDLNQVMTNSDVMIYAAQCDFANGGGTWEFSNGWGLDSNIKCPKSSWVLNGWNHVLINAHRCSNFVSGQPCIITYDSVSLNGVTTQCTSNCTANGRDGLSWGPVGLLLANVQVDMSFTSAGSTKFYVDLMTVNSPESTTMPVPTFTPSSGNVPQVVTLGCGTGSGCYTEDGSTPLGNGGGNCLHGTKYTSAINVTTPLTLNAICSKDGIDLDSAMGSASYTSGSEPMLKCDSLTGAITITNNVATITNPVGTNCTLK